MSRKNTNQAERDARKVRKALRNTPQGYIDLIQYVKTKTRCTTGMARKVLLSGALRVDSHPVGFKWGKDLGGRSVKQLDPYLRADMYDRLQVQWTPEDA